MNNAQWIWLVVAIAIAVVLAIVAYGLFSARSKRRSALLRERFGEEYDRARQQFGSRTDRVLAERLERVEKFHVRDLSDADRNRFAASWKDVQAQFVDDPRRAVARANDLIVEVMRARGYSADDAFERRAADLSVDHADVVEHYRAAHALMKAAAPLDTEQLRQAVVHYRVIFADLLAPSTAAAAPVPAMRVTPKPA
ncbi:MAG TPA: hypothetical protein VGH28_16895 [Polyangiaceae bacterium]|jgi:hypothetical protein